MYRTKPQLVEAVQWFPEGPKIPGVESGKPVITYSHDGQHYYCTHGIEQPKFWLSVRKYPGVPVPAAVIAEPYCIPFNDGDDAYWRLLHTCVRYKIRSGATLEISQDSELWKDYDLTAITEAGCRQEPAQLAFFISSGRQQVLRPGDWVVTDRDNKRSAITNEEFQKLYERII